MVKGILLERSVQLIMVPDPCQWLDCEDAITYPYKKTFEEARYEPFAVVHTSGSTGISHELLSVFQFY